MTTDRMVMNASVAKFRRTHRRFGIKSQENFAYVNAMDGVSRCAVNFGRTRVHMALRNDALRTVGRCDGWPKKCMLSKQTIFEGGFTVWRAEKSHFRPSVKDA